MSDSQYDWPNNLSLEFVEQLYADFLKDPASVPPDWRRRFEESADTHDGDSKPTATRIPGNGTPRPLPRRTAPQARLEIEVATQQERVDLLVRNFRVRGHLHAHLNPLEEPAADTPEIDPQFYGFTEQDMVRPFSYTTGGGGQSVLPLGQLIDRMRHTYCRSIGVQFMHIDDLRVREWLQSRMESTQNHYQLDRREQIRILTRLTDAVLFEQFIQKKFIGAKSFSLEGGETLIPLLDLLIEKNSEQSVEEIVFGMAHRGRLNVLAHIMGKRAELIFREFEDDNPSAHIGRGDVKYHLGYSRQWETTSGKLVNLALCFNPSHLEYVNGVAMGRVRAKHDRLDDAEHAKSMCILIHGDAAFAGEGVVQECLNLSELSGYRIGGTMHIIINNQIGFTTPPHQGRSSHYATDVGKMLQIPIFHVNGEDPEAVAQVVRLASEFRKQFKRDVIIDLYCYRRRGHNEGDEPSFTQPMMYKKIDKRPTVRESYLEKLLTLGGVTRAEADNIERQRHARLEEELTVARRGDVQHQPEMIRGVWANYQGGLFSEVKPTETGVEKEQLSKLLNQLTVLPDSFTPHPKIKRGLKIRQDMASGKRPLDWAAGEALAFATLAVDGHRIRLSGQDCTRGTFSHRHGVLYDYETGEPYEIFEHLDEKQAHVRIFNSPLSEAGVLGFEYGYSLGMPEGLTLWEAQFGDFVNAAQVIIDQFIASAEDKWNRLSGLTLLLPHGFEGQGPEHSSARLERFLMLAAEDNMQVANPTTPAQYFHILRRQVVSPWRKPLILMTPKSLLRHPECVSSLDELATGGFQEIIGDSSVEMSKIKRLLLCSGKVYYDLHARRQELDRSDVAIVRLEQYYPLLTEKLGAILAEVPDGTPTYWVQEEPENMGAWWFLRHRFDHKLFDRLPFHVISRAPSASPATGSKAAHKHEQESLLREALEFDA